MVNGGGVAGLVWGGRAPAEPGPGRACLPIGAARCAQWGMASHTDPTHPSELRPIDIRRAVLAVFLRADGGPLGIAEVIRLTRDDSHLDLTLLPGPPAHRRVSDLLRHQVRAGRAQVVARATYRLFVEEFSRSTQWRCLHWDEARRDWLRRRYLGMP